MHDRFPAYGAAAARATPSAIVVHAGPSNDRMLTASLSGKATRPVIGRWAVYLAPDGIASLGSLQWAPEPDLWVGLQLPVARWPRPASLGGDPARH